MIINKRFFRKLHNKIYLLLCTVILTSLIIFSGYIRSIQEILNLYCQDHSVVLMITKNDVEKQINQFKGIHSISSDKLVFEPNDKKNTIFTHQGYILEGKDGIISELEADNTKLFWEDFEVLNHLIVGYDKNLKGNEVSLLSSTYLEEEKIEKSLNQSMDIIYQNKEYSFKIKNIEKSAFSEIRISKEMYDSMYKNKNNYTYLIRFNDKTSLNLFYDQSTEKFNPIFRDANIENNSDHTKYEEILSLYNSLKYIIYIVIIIILFVIVLNITSDEKKDINLDYILGYNKKIIKNNLLKIYAIFGCIVSISSIVLSLIINLTLRNNIQLGLNIYDVFTYIIMLFIILIINAILVKIRVDD